jgi:nitrogen fixation protein FixH
MTREFTGWHMAALMVGGFGVIIGVNLFMAYQAISTFPGLEVQNSYVASQSFDADRAAQDGLGWDVQVALGDGQITLDIGSMSGPVQPEITQAILGRATHTAADQTPAFEWVGSGFTAPVMLEPGNWNLRLELRAEDGTLFRRRIPLVVIP